MDCRQACYEIRRRTLGYCNGVVRRVLASRSDSFAWNGIGSGIRYCPNKEPAPSLYQLVSDSDLPDACGSVRRLRDMAPHTSSGFASLRERQLFSFHQERFAVKPVEEPITLMTLAMFSKDQILQTLSDLCGRQVNSTNYRTTFLQYLQLCRRVGIQFRVSLSNNQTQCLSCLQHASVSLHRFRCDCYPIKLLFLQDCNCECGTSIFCCTCDAIPQMCYDLDVLAGIVTGIQQSFQDLLVCTDQTFADFVMSRPVNFEFLLWRIADESTTIRLSQFEPP